MLALTHLAHDLLSPALPVSMGAGVSEQVAGVLVTGVSAAGVITTGVSATGVTVAPALGSLELEAATSTLFCESQWDSAKCFFTSSANSLKLVFSFSYAGSRLHLLSEGCACFGECL